MTTHNRYDPPLPSYPWPTITSPFADRFFDEEITWYDTDYSFLSKSTRDKYKRHGIYQVSAFLTPSNSDLDKLRPIARSVIYHTIFDDYYELCPTVELVPLADHLADIILGEKPHAEDNGILHQAAKAANEFRALGMPDHWLERLANTMREYVIYGVIAENSYKESENGFPSSGYALFVHEYTIGMCPLYDMIEVVTGSVLPRSVFEHPVIQRARSLSARIHALQNDFASVSRELSRKEVEGFNYIIALKYENKISLDEARAEALRVHDTAVGELVALHQALPAIRDIAPHFDLVNNYIYHQELMITGLGDWYERGNSIRYNTIGGYPEPEYEGK